MTLFRMFILMGAVLLIGFFSWPWIDRFFAAGVLSGTYYVTVAPGASRIRFEDPRLAMMMASPPRAVDAPEEDRQFVYVEPRAGQVLLWEAFLRHEVPANASKADRISISFNYAWK